MTYNEICDDSKDELNKYEGYLDLLKSISTFCEGKIEVNKLDEITKLFISIFKDEAATLSYITKINEASNDNYMHCIKVAIISLLIGKWNNYEEDKLQELVLTGLLHDIGKTNKEYIENRDSTNKIIASLIYKRHPIMGYEKLARLGGLDAQVLNAVLTHHEKCDGTGFPLGIKGDRISDIAKIVGLANEYDRLRQTMHLFDVIKELRVNQMGAFEVDLVIDFCSNIISNYVGNEVLLSTGERAIIKEIQPHALYRPIVTVNGRCVDLYVESEIIIEKVY